MTEILIFLGGGQFIVFVVVLFCFVCDESLLPSSTPLCGLQFFNSYLVRATHKYPTSTLLLDKWIVFPRIHMNLVVAKVTVFKQ